MRRIVAITLIAFLALGSTATADPSEGPVATIAPDAPDAPDVESNPRDTTPEDEFINNFIPECPDSPDDQPTPPFCSMPPPQLDFDPNFDSGYSLGYGLETPPVTADPAFTG